MPKDLATAWNVRYRRWRRFVHASIKTMESGKVIPTGPSAKPLEAPPVKPSRGQPLRVVMCSAHPDDEALVGALPLRLHRECGASVTNCAINLGSNLGHRARRLCELTAACAVLGFDLVVANGPMGFDDVTLDNRQNHPEEWVSKVRVLSRTLEQERPDAVFAPHAGDFNATHIGTHYLVLDALGDYLERTGHAPLPFFETEFWQQNACPNLLVGVAPDDEAILIMATAEHGGEVPRNPYHLRHLSRMVDNVRRGGEVVGGQGAAAPDFHFGEIYRLAFMDGRNMIAPRTGGHVIGPAEKIDLQKLIEMFWPEDLERRGFSPAVPRPL